MGVTQGAAWLLTLSKINKGRFQLINSGKGWQKTTQMRLFSLGVKLKKISCNKLFSFFSSKLRIVSILLERLRCEFEH